MKSRPHLRSYSLGKPPSCGTGEHRRCVPRTTYRPTALLAYCRAIRFGFATTILHYATPDGASGGWRIFALDSAGRKMTSRNSIFAAANLLVLTPGGVNILDSDRVEDVLLLRDERRRTSLRDRRQALSEPTRQSRFEFIYEARGRVPEPA